MVQKHQFFGAQTSLWSNSHTHSGHSGLRRPQGDPGAVLRPPPLSLREPGAPAGTCFHGGSSPRTRRGDNSEWGPECALPQCPPQGQGRAWHDPHGPALPGAQPGGSPPRVPSRPAEGGRSQAGKPRVWSPGGRVRPRSGIRPSGVTAAHRLPGGSLRPAAGPLNLVCRVMPTGPRDLVRTKGAAVKSPAPPGPPPSTGAWPPP